jgi:hypothetical protein
MLMLNALPDWTWQSGQWQTATASGSPEIS